MRDGNVEACTGLGGPSTVRGPVTSPNARHTPSDHLGALRDALASRYALGVELGRGAMSVVYRARDLRHDRDVAVKVLRGDVSSAIGSDRFLREIRIAARLQHPHILPLLDSGEAGGLLYYVMPDVEGGSLRDRLDHEAQLPIQEAVRIAREVGTALACAHGLGIIHRDIKPANILLSSGVAIVADFGIARAIAEAGGGESGTTGMVIGTPGYMSPEQAVGDRLDGRSDIFSLGCVLYEMLAGERPFTGPTPQAITARLVHAPMPPLRVVRGSVPLALERVVERALAKHAADRFHDAGELVRALEAIRLDAPNGVADAAPPPPRPRRRVTLGGVALAVVIAAIASVDTVRDRLGGANGPVADTTRLVVFPLDQSADGSVRTIHDHMLYTALSRWRGISLVEHYQVADVLRRSGPVGSASDASARAKALGAGRYIRGAITNVGDSADVTAALYDVGNQKPLETAAARLASDPAGAAAGYARIAQQLLLRAGAADLGEGDPAIQRSLPALQAFGRAQRALDEWDLGAADSAFEAAVAFDATDPRSQLWLAQVRAWRDLPTTSWSVAAERAAAGAALLGERERTLAGALVLLARSEYGAACAAYDTLRQRNDRDFAAWFGLGECRRRDRLVLAAPSSPSGWQFRSSYDRAMKAYARAFEVLPSAHRGFERGAFERLRVLLRISTSLAPGFAVAGRDTTTFFARPAWLGDTLALIPYPWQVVSAGGANAIPPGFEEALDRQRALFRKIADGWAAAFPRSSGAREAVAIALELQGDRSAIDTLRVARRLATDTARIKRLAATEALLLLKFGAPDDLAQLRTARALADSLLAMPDRPAESELMGALASLVGRCDAADRLARQSAPTTSPRVSQQLLMDSHALMARSALGCSLGPPTPSVSALLQRIAREFRTASPTERHLTEEQLLFRPALLAPRLDSAVIDELGTASAHSLLHAARALVRHDTAGVRNELTAFEKSSTAGSVPMGPDFALPAARLWVAVGDTVSAIRMLDRTLADAPSYDPSMFTGEGAIVASFIRAMVFRAQLGAATKDDAAAARWGGAARSLWDDADPPLRQVVRGLGGGSSRR